MERDSAALAGHRPNDVPQLLHQECLAPYLQPLSVPSLLQNKTAASLSYAVASRRCAKSLFADLDVDCRRSSSERFRNR